MFGVTSEFPNDTEKYLRRQLVEIEEDWRYIVVGGSFNLDNIPIIIVLINHTLEAKKCCEYSKKTGSSKADILEKK